MEKDFYVLDVKLEGSKLIEASAGTGKTYSIAILALRLILEKQIPLEEILMVTFTKAAVAELESRIRKFVRLAYKYSAGKEISDPTIQAVVGVVNEEKKALLRKAVQGLDSLSVMTIHSFCQKTIGEFTFETNQSFDYEIITDDSALLKDASNRYYREVLNVLDVEYFKEIWKGLKRDKMHELLKKHLLGMKFIDSSLDEDATLLAIKQHIADKQVAFDDFIVRNFIQILTLQIKSNALLTDAKAGNVEEFKRRFRDQIKKPAGYFSNFEFMVADFQKHEQGIKYAENEFFNYFYLSFLRHSSGEIEKTKQQKGYISYDDQIKTIHTALKNESFREKLAQKYKAVFIDEFQDTDKQQYEIFSDVFSASSIVFYIGDPKQSIYGWRSADLDTYKEARKNVDGSVFSMNKNFRSTKGMIDALNVLMNPDESFNMFVDDDIRYVNVGQGASGLGKMCDQGKAVLPVTIWEFDENDYETVYKAVAQETYRLLTGDVEIKGRKITPRDIGILVWGKKEGDAIKKTLAGFNVPSVKRDEAKVLESCESGMIKHLLKAVVSPGRGDINRALNSSYFGFTTETLKTLDDEKQIAVFIGLRKTLLAEGVYNMISSFLTIYGVRACCMKDILGQRVLTNINQIAEILHKKEKQSRLTPDELLVWMDRSSGEADEDYEQRVESDDDAVQISTIHKAKGLEYNIVFAPCLSMIPKKKFLEKGNINDFKKNGGYFFTLNYPGLSEEDRIGFDSQKEQENKRLIYVALTRAVYKCYISIVPRKYKKDQVPSSLSDIIGHFKNESPGLIEFDTFSNDGFVTNTVNYHPGNGGLEFSPRPKPEIEIKNAFGIHSFSALSHVHLSAPFEKVELGDKESYDQFIFQDLGRGANVGTALHSIFELLDFNAVDSWDRTIQDASKYYPSIVKAESLHLFGQMVSHVMHTELSCGEETFALHQVKNGQKLTELEFYFSMDNVNKMAINEALGIEAQLEGEADMQGLMHGFLDLFLEHNGRYYILDWKSNFLGNRLEDYGRDGLAEGMKGNNYYLQYYIYTVAMKRHLENKLPGFDYERDFGGVIYLFLRGVRSNNSTGIFYAKPALHQIESLENLLLRRK